MTNTTQDSKKVWPTKTDEYLDLHGRTVEEAKMATDNMLNFCSIGGVSQVTISYGQGEGILKKEIGLYLMEHPLVETIRFHTSEQNAWVVEVVDARHD